MKHKYGGTIVIITVFLPDLLEQFVDASCYERVCLYLISCVPYVPEPEDKNLLKTSLNLYYKFEVH